MPEMTVRHPFSKLYTGHKFGPQPWQFSILSLMMGAYEVSLLVNDPRKDSPACIEPSDWPPSQASLI